MDSRSIDNMRLLPSMLQTTKLAAIQSVYDEYGKPLNLGFVDPSTGLKIHQTDGSVGLSTVIDAYL